MEEGRVWPPGVTRARGRPRRRWIGGRPKPARHTKHTGTERETVLADRLDWRGRLAIEVNKEGMSK